MDDVVVRWKEAGSNAEPAATLLSADAVRHFARDGYTERATAAHLLVRAAFDERPHWKEMALGRDIAIEILEPEIWAGRYAVAISQTVRDGELRYGFMAYPISSRRHSPDDIAALHRLTTPEMTLEAYDLLSTRNGDDASWPMDLKASDEMRGQVAALKQLYRDGLLIDLGKIAHWKATREIGVLLEATLEPDQDFPDQDEIDAFRSDTGLFAQPALPFGHDLKVLVAFVPQDQVARAREIAGRLRAMAAPSPSPAL